MNPESMNNFPDPYNSNNFPGTGQTYDSGQGTNSSTPVVPQNYQSYTPPQYTAPSQSYYAPQTPQPSQQYSSQQSNQSYQQHPQNYNAQTNQPYMPQQYPQSYPPGNPYGYPMPNHTVKNTAGLVCGIISIFVCWLPLIGLILGIVGLCLSLKARSDGNKPGNTSDGLVVPGIICSAIGGIVSFLLAALVVIVVIGTVNDPDFASDDYGDYGEYSYYEYYEPGEYT